MAIMRIGLGPQGGAEAQWGGSKVELGGQSGGPPPLEMMLCALAACTFQAALAYCQASGTPADGLRLEQEMDLSQEGSPLESLEQRLILPAGFPEEAERALLWMAGNGPAGNLLRQPPEIKLSLCRE